jgi:hypothetical protein
MYLVTLTRGLLPWVWPPHQAVATALSSGVEDSELLEACRWGGSLRSCQQWLIKDTGVAGRDLANYIMPCSILQVLVIC